MTRIPYTGLSLFACHKLTAVLFSEPLKFHFCPSWSRSCWRRFLGWRNLSSFTAPFQGCWSHPIFFFFLYFILLGYMVIFLVILVSWDRLPAFSSYSVRIVPTCSCIFDVFVGGGELQIFLFHHLDPAPLNSFLFCFFWMEITKQQQYIKSIWSNVPFKASFLNDFLSGWSARWCKWDVKSSLLLLCYCQFFPLGLLIFVVCLLGALLLGHIYL